MRNDSTYPFWILVGVEFLEAEGAALERDALDAGGQVAAGETRTLDDCAIIDAGAAPRVDSVRAFIQ